MKVWNVGLLCIVFFSACQKEALIVPRQVPVQQTVQIKSTDSLSSSTANKLVVFDAFSGSSASGKVTLQFATSQEVNVSYFQVMSGKDGKQLCEIAKIFPSGGDSHSVKKYSFTDTHPKGNPTYYILSCIGKNNELSFSNLIQVAVNN